MKFGSIARRNVPPPARPRPRTPVRPSRVRPSKPVEPAPLPEGKVGPTVRLQTDPDPFGTGQWLAPYLKKADAERVKTAIATRRLRGSKLLRGDIVSDLVSFVISNLSEQQSLYEQRTSDEPTIAIPAALKTDKLAVELGAVLVRFYEGKYALPQDAPQAKKAVETTILKRNNVAPAVFPPIGGVSRRLPG